MKNKLINFICGGIKCDNPECDYADITVSVEDYKDWINKPCPKCGANLLTQADYDNVQQILCFVDKFNETPCEETCGNDETLIHISMNGTGKMDFEIVEA